jgi:hypothetical protein
MPIQADNTIPTELEASCPYCGAPAGGGYPACQAVMHELTARQYELGLRYKYHRAFVDCYTLQHPEIYCVSAKSYAAHLTGLCCYLEMEGQQEVQAAVQRWLSGSPDLVKPPVPDARGALTVLHLLPAQDVASFIDQLDEWARAIWQAYAELQGTARQTIQLALRD